MAFFIGLSPLGGLYHKKYCYDLDSEDFLVGSMVGHVNLFGTCCLCADIIDDQQRRNADGFFKCIRLFSI